MFWCHKEEEYGKWCSFTNSLEYHRRCSTVNISCQQPDAVAKSQALKNPRRHLQKKWITRVDPNSGHSDRGQVIRLGQAKWARAIGTRYMQVEWNTWNCANGFGCLWSQGLHREIRKQRRLLRKSCSYAWLLKEMLLCSPVRWKLVGSGWWRWDRKVLKVSVAQLFSEVLPLCAA